MMKKTTSALAIAALLGTGAASAATFQIDDSTTFSVSGDVELKYLSDTIDEGSDSTDTDNNWDGGKDLNGGGSEIKFSGERSFDNGLTTFFTLDVDGFDVTGNDQSIKQDESTFFGVRGDFGTVTFGDINTSDDAIRDLADPMDSLTLDTVWAPGESNETLQYASPSFGMASFVVDVSGGVGDGSESRYSGRLDIDLGTAVLHAGYTDFADGNDDGFDTSINLGASTVVGGITLSANFGMFQDVGDNDFNAANVSAVAPVGAANVYGVVGHYDDDAGNDFTQYGLGVNYSITSNLSVFAEGASFDDIELDAAGGDQKPDQFAIGTILTF